MTLLDHIRPSEVQQILRLRAAGRTVTEMQRLVGRPRHVIQQVLERERGEKPPKRRGKKC